MRNYDDVTGRPLHDGREALQTLADDELEAELTIALLEQARRVHRLSRLEQELLVRRRRRHDRDLVANIR
jgi:hypothetical protein